MTSTAKPKYSVPPIIYIALAMAVLTLTPQVAKLWPNALWQPKPAMGDRLSLGDKILLAPSSEKQDAAAEFANGDYASATTKFSALLSRQRNDPESLIYLNNARIGEQAALTIAVSVPIGSNPNVAQEILRGVAQSQDEVNQAGGINGKKLRVQIANDDNDPAIASQIATTFVNDSQIVAVVGHNSSNASVAAAPLYRQSNLVMVTPTSFSNQLSGFGPNIFRTIPATRFVAEPLAKHIVKTTSTARIAVCYDSQSPDNVVFKDEFVASLVANGGTMVNIDCNLVSPSLDPKQAIAAALKQNATGLLLNPHIDRIDRALSVARANQDRLALFSSPTLYTIQTLESGSSTVKGLVLPVIWHPQLPAAQTFAQRAKQYWGGTVNWRTATAYDATQAIIAGLNQTPSRDRLAETLHQSGFSASGASGDIRFLPTGDRLSQPTLVQVQPTASGYEFVPLR
jgi:branched-chain amino acid transport system substrate-binding protein